MTRWRALRIRARAAGLLADPYYEWARATSFSYYGKAKWLPVLLELRDTTTQEFAGLIFEMQKRKKDEQEWAAHLRIPPFYATRPERLSKPTRFLAVLATKQFLKSVYGGADPSGSIKRFELGRAVQPSTAANVQAGAPKPIKKAKGKPKVITGVIDDGIGFAHERFWASDDKTRVEYFWDQLEPSNVWGDWGYGRQIDKHDPVEGIDKRMQDSRHGSLVDEDELYRLSGHVDHSRPGHKPLALSVAHGTHVMDLAANAIAKPKPGRRPLIAVQLPTATTADTSGAKLGPQVYNGLAYMIDRAEAIATAAKTAQLPVVVNVSYGMIAGPHDGSSMLEEAMDELLESCNPVDGKGKPLTPSFRVVLPAGNNHLSRCHAVISLEANASKELHWRVLPDDWTESYVQIWLPEKDDGGNNANLSITITAPDGTATVAFAAGEAQAFEIGGNLVGKASYFPPGDVGRRALVVLALAPTGWPDGGLNLAPHGLWRIKIDNALGKAKVSDIHAWIQRDDTPLGYRPRGRQSYFDDPDYRRYDDGGRSTEVDNAASYVKRAGTINAIATGKHPIVIGGFRRSEWAPAPDSARGPVVHPPGRGNPSDDGPDAMAPSDDAPSYGGVLAAGTRSGSCVAMSGTSVAAPEVTLWLAERMANNKTSDRKAVFDHAATQEVGRPDTPVPERGGGGRIPLPSTRPTR